MSRLEKGSIEQLKKEFGVGRSFPLLVHQTCEGCGDDLIREFVWTFAPHGVEYLAWHGWQYLCKRCANTADEVALWAKVEQERRANQKPRAPNTPPQQVEVIVKQPAERIIATPKPPSE